MAAEQGYESARKKLTGERETIQKKTFTKWVNSFLKGVSFDSVNTQAGFVSFGKDHASSEESTQFLTLISMAHQT